jgi:hypothetical protein
MLGPDVDETVTYFQQETGEWIDFVVLGIRRCKEGIRYTVIYAGNEDTEVELSEHEMEDILNQSMFTESEQPGLPPVVKVVSKM